jgi:hypothetical protein
LGAAIFMNNETRPARPGVTRKTSGILPSVNDRLLYSDANQQDITATR